MSKFSYALLQSRFLLKNEWKRLLLWLIITVGFTLISLGNTVASYPDQASLDKIFVTMQMPMIQILFGSFAYQSPNTQSFEFVIESFMILIILVVIMNLFLTVRFNRLQEDVGVTELVLTTSAGRFSPLLSATIIVTLQNILVGIGVFASVSLFNLDGSSISGNLLLSGIVFGIGWLFQSLAMISCQIFGTSQGASTLSFAGFGTLFLLRMYADLENTDLKSLSPLSWGSTVSPYQDDVSWPIWVCIGLSVLFIVTAFLLNRLRDVGAGLIPDQKGKAEANRLLNNPFALRFKTDRGTVMIWGVTLLVFGIMFGTLFESIGDLAENPIFSQILGANTHSFESQLIKSLFSLLAVILAIVVTLPGLQIFLHLKKDQLSGGFELYYPTGISRTTVFMSYYLPSVLTALFLFVLSVLGIWGGAQFSDVTNIDFLDYVSGALNLIPFILVILSFTALLYVFVQKLSNWVYGLVGVMFFILILGEMFDFPDWINQAAIFGLLEEVPVHAIDWTTWGILLAVSFVFSAVSYWGFLQKDMTNQ